MSGGRIVLVEFKIDPHQFAEQRALSTVLPNYDAKTRDVEYGSQ